MKTWGMFFLLLCASCVSVNTRPAAPAPPDAEQAVAVEFTVISNAFTRIALSGLDSKTGKVEQREDFITKIRIEKPKQYRGMEKEITHDEKKDIRWVMFGSKGAGKIRRKALEEYSPLRAGKDLLDIQFK